LLGSVIGEHVMMAGKRSSVSWAERKKKTKPGDIKYVFSINSYIWDIIAVKSEKGENS